MTEVRQLRWRRKHHIRDLLANEDRDRGRVADRLVLAFHYETSPDGSEYWYRLRDRISVGEESLPLSTEIKAKLVAIMLLPAKRELD